jgi:sporulation protein YlmC with PRC-barrel domain
MTRKIAVLAFSSVICVLASRSLAQEPPPAGQITLGITVAEAELVAAGWRVSKLIGTSVQNEKGEKIGKIDDMIVAPNGTLTIAVIEVGGFLGIGTHRVAIPVRQLKLATKAPKVVLAGATQDALKALPEFKYLD